MAKKTVEELEHLNSEMLQVLKAVELLVRVNCPMNNGSTIHKSLADLIRKAER